MKQRLEQLNFPNEEDWAAVDAKAKAALSAKGRRDAAVAAEAKANAKAKAEAKAAFDASGG